MVDELAHGTSLQTCRENVQVTESEHSMDQTSCGSYLFLISAAMVMNACSTLVAFLALVSKKGMPISSAKACKNHSLGLSLLLL